jgi:hypothetical protein
MQPPAPRRLRTGDGDFTARMGTGAEAVGKRLGYDSAAEAEP